MIFVLFFQFQKVMVYLLTIYKRLFTEVVCFVCLGFNDAFNIFDLLRGRKTIYKRLFTEVEKHILTTITFKLIEEKTCKKNVIRE